MRRHSMYLAALVAVASTGAMANPGEDGDQAFGAGAIVVNGYSRLTSSAAAGAATISVPDIAELALPGAACPTACNLGLQVGDLLAIYQPQGATIDATDTSAFGSVTALNEAGRYEFVYVESVTDNAFPTPDTIAITLPGADCPTGLRYAYTVSATAGVAPPMVVRVPQYQNLTVSAGASLVAADWAWTAGSTGLGGILAIDVRGTPEGTTGVLTLDGSLSADGAGFRGGVDSTPGGTVPYAGFVSASNSHGEKGESVAGNWVFYDGIGGRYGRGAPANGGGGGDGINASGGGGANAGDPTQWTIGRGVRDTAYDAAWALDTEVAPGGTPGNDSGGGRGGYTWSNADADASVSGPGDIAWIGDNRQNVGGLGGRPITGNVGGEPYRRVYFGGGGGAGEMNNSKTSNGADGGGLVVVIARQITTTGTGARTISANGLTATGTAGAPLDGLGGAGAGGTVLVTTSFSQPLAADLNLVANGGAGATHVTVNGDEAEGGGGGGGGGAVLVSHFTASESFAGGASGSTLSPALSEFPPNGATGGAAGNVVYGPERFGPGSPFVCLQGPNFTTPVTNTYFEAQAQGSQVRVRFASGSEIAHAGYLLYGAHGDGPLHRIGSFVPAQGGEGSAPAAYETLINESITEFYLADLDLSGRETRRGPFQLGTVYGAPPTAVPYNWAVSRQELANYQSTRRGSGSAVGKLLVRDRGMYSVSYEQLLAAGVLLGGTPVNALAVVGENGPVPRRVRGGASFGPGSSIEFFGDAKASLWSRDLAYLVLADASKVRNMPLSTKVVAPAATASYRAEVSYAPQVAYNEAAPTGDPWYADRLVSQGGVATKSLTLTGPAPASASGELEVLLWGGIDWPGQVNDHSARVLLNGQVVGSQRWDGISSVQIRVPVALASGGNQVTIEIPGDTGQPADIVHVESVKLRYAATAVGDGAKFFGSSVTGTAWDTIFKNGVGDSIGEPIAGVITVTGVGGQDLRAYRIVGGHAAEFSVSAAPVALYSAGFPSDAEVWISPAAQLLTPVVATAAVATDLFGAPSDWLAITHGNFAPALTALAARRQQQGMTTRIVDVEQIYTRYSAGNPNPESIRQYIADAKAQLGVDYVVLVGADTTDAPGYAGSGSVSFVPAPYATTSLFVRYAPVDPLLADTDRNGQPDVAIGRLPVRTLAEAQEAVRKILAYETQPAANSAMAIAGPVDSAMPKSFTAYTQDFSAGLSASWTVNPVYQDVLGLNPARQAVIDGFNNGRSLVSYVGHSGPTRWTFDPLFDISQVLGTSSDPNRPNLAVSSNQPIVLQFACWTTYFVSATQNTMAQALLLTPNKGASAIVGATVLLDQMSHERMANAVSSRLLAGARIGDVIQAAKSELAANPTNPAGPEILLGQILLGDPAQPIR